MENAKITNLYNLDEYKSGRTTTEVTEPSA
jgi:hypothetical protein